MTMSATTSAAGAGGTAPGPRREDGILRDPFTSSAESAVCERVLGDRRHGLDPS
jgi:hypothetical protein